MSRGRKFAGMALGYTISGLSSLVGWTVTDINYEKGIGESCQPVVQSILDKTPLSSEYSKEIARQTVNANSTYSSEFYRQLQHAPLTPEDARRAADYITSQVAQYIKIPENLSATLQNGIMSCTSKAPDALSVYVQNRTFTDPLFWAAMTLIIGTPIGAYIAHRLMKVK